MRQFSSFENHFIRKDLMLHLRGSTVLAHTPDRCDCKVDVLLSPAEFRNLVIDIVCMY